MLLSVDSLTKTYKQHKAVEDLTLHIQDQQCVALLGPNGAGKSTTLNMLAGLLTPSSGQIAFMGETKINRSEIGYLPQYPAFFNWMTAIEYLEFAGRLSRLSKKELQHRCEEMLGFVGLEEDRNKKIGRFSGGMKQRLGLAQAMLHHPKLLILDEPVSALDPEGRRDVLSMMLELKKRMAILFSTHVLHDAEQVCDEIVMLKQGKVQWSGTLDSLRKQKQAEQVFMLATEEKLEGWLTSRDYISEYTSSNPFAAEVKLKAPNTRNELLTDIINSHLTITRFELKHQTLEDAYLEVMNK